MKKIHIFLFIFFLVSFGACTCSISMVHSQGQASDVIDQEETPTATLSPTLNTL